jgi:hypothetical protein
MKAERKNYSSICMAVMIFALTLAGNPCLADTDDAAGLTPAAYGRGIVPLTKGSSTTLQNATGQARSLVTVLALGQGTLKVTLSKKDTTNDVISVLLIGYPADPAFVPGFGITPADVAVSAAVTDALGGYGIFFIITTINSTETYSSSLALKLE